MWSEVDTESNFYNKNFDESLAENGLQPKKSKYDNSKAYNKLVAKEHNANFLSALKDAYSKANSNYSYLKSASPLRLAQIPGGFLHKATHGDNFLKGVGTALADQFAYRAYDEGYGDYETKGLFRADGSPLNFIETKFRSMLPQTDMISRDLLKSFALYYKASVNYKLMSERVNDIEIILKGIKETKTSGMNDDGEYDQTEKGATRMYKRSKQSVDSSVYGKSKASKYSIKVGKNHTIAMAKPIKTFLEYVRNIELIIQRKGYRS